MGEPKPNPERLQQLIEQRGYTVPQFTRIILGEERAKGRNIVKELEKRPNMTSSTLFRICRILDIPMESLFLEADNRPSSHTIDGNHNIINSGVINSSVDVLNSKIEALEQTIKVKDELIENVKMINSQILEQLGTYLKVGQNRDTNMPTQS